MGYDDLLGTIRADGAAMTAAARLGMRAAVPSCPGWDIETLVNHTGRVHRWATAIAATKAPAPFPPRPDDVTPEWLEEGVAELCGTLQGLDPDLPLWNFLGADAVAGFWFRRMAHETAIHRWDAENAHGVATPVEPLVALSGIDEVFDVYLKRALGKASDAVLGGSIHLHATDAADEGGEWLVAIDGGSARVEREHGKGDLAVRGTASDLLLLLWGRLDLSSFEVFGDAAIFDRWRQLAVTA